MSEVKLDLRPFRLKSRTIKAQQYIFLTLQLATSKG